MSTPVRVIAGAPLAVGPTPKKKADDRSSDSLREENCRLLEESVRLAEENKRLTEQLRLQSSCTEDLRNIISGKDEIIVHMRSKCEELETRAHGAQRPAYGHPASIARAGAGMVRNSTLSNGAVVVERMSASILEPGNVVEGGATAPAASEAAQAVVTAPTVVRTSASTPIRRGRVSGPAPGVQEAGPGVCTMPPGARGQPMLLQPSSLPGGPGAN